jgi:cysteine desulfurase
MQAIYLDHAATTPLDKRVFEKMQPYFMQTFGNADSLHSFGRTAVRAVDTAREQVADLLGAKFSEIYFTSGGTESDNWAIIGGMRAQKASGKTRLVTTQIEHHAVLSAAKSLEKEGFDVCYLPVDKGGMVEMNALKAELAKGDVGLVAVMAANNETGVLQDILTLAAESKKAGALFFTDAVQAAPYMPLDVNELGVDMLSFSAHKFYGPKGAGALYVRSGVKVDPIILGGEQERGLRGGTTNVSGVVGLAEAYALTRREMQQNNQKTLSARRAFENTLFALLSGVHVNGAGEKIPSVLNVRIDGVNAATLLKALDLEGIAASAGSACTSGSALPSHVLGAMGLSTSEVASSLRFSFGKDNVEEECAWAAAAVAKIALKLRG